MRANCFGWSRRELPKLCSVLEQTLNRVARGGMEVRLGFLRFAPVIPVHQAINVLPIPSSSATLLLRCTRYPQSYLIIRWANTLPLRY